jgi:carbon-monoxide dehydrogenase medium subunit
MKPAAFEYHRPGTVAEALAVLAEVGHDGKVLAGGQSLVPLLNMRLAAPAHLVDVNWLAELDEVACDPGGVRVGAIARHARVEHDPGAAEAVPLLRQAIGDIAHTTVRNRGTVVGSLVHADPAAELPAVLVLLGGGVELASAGNGSRRVAAADFFVGPLESALRPGELATAAVFPRPPAGSGSAWLELARRHGDYAVCGAGVLVRLDQGLRVASARAALLSVGPVPVAVDLTDRPAPPGRRRLGRRRAPGPPPRRPGRHPAATYRRHWPGCPPAGRQPAASAADQLGSEGVRVSEPLHETAWWSTGCRTPFPCRPGGCRRTARHDRLTGTRRLRASAGPHGPGRRAALVSLLFAVGVDGAEITTVEGCRSAGGGLGPVQQAFQDCHGLQCGFCTPGFVTTITAYLREHPDPTEEQARQAIGGNLCRCTGYQNIVASVLRAASGSTLKAEGVGSPGGARWSRTGGAATRTMGEPIARREDRGWSQGRGATWTTWAAGRWRRRSCAARTPPPGCWTST